MSVAGSLALLGARILMASVFFFSAWGKLRGDERDLQAIVGLHLPYPNLLTVTAGACEIIGALMLISGAGARIAALLLALFLLAVTFAFLRFWTLPQGDARFNVENAFFGNLGLIGGLTFVMVTGPGSLALLPTT